MNAAPCLRECFPITSKIEYICSDLIYQQQARNELTKFRTCVSQGGVAGPYGPKILPILYSRHLISFHFPFSTLIFSDSVSRSNHWDKVQEKIPKNNFWKVWSFDAFTWILIRSVGILINLIGIRDALKKKKKTGKCGNFSQVGYSTILSDNAEVDADIRIRMAIPSQDPSEPKMRASSLIILWI